MRLRVRRRSFRRRKEVLACRFLLDLSVAETAALLGATQGTVKSNTARALDRLRQLLADDPVAPQPARPEVPHAD
jgi:DNA-directed RNA polymerase specialized sigma24 family protein